MLELTQIARDKVRNGFLYIFEETLNEKECVYGHHSRYARCVRTALGGPVASATAVNSNVVSSNTRKTP